ncbi:class I SAM-dependent methyltransferase [Cytobacillus sp. FSL R7-0696]|uniref:class I SAM-dependent methyltransferase n=1 Tax=Cytobacillus sp. FSL R7-0696 TaxID=2921691 RepID=UPI0030F5A146
MFVTTSARTNPDETNKAKQVAMTLNLPFLHRRKRTIKSMVNQYETNGIVVGKERMELYKVGEERPFFFHPSSAMFRLKRLQKGEHDPLIEICQLKAGSSFLDCTLGLASDSIVASYAVGETGKVIGLEASKVIAYFVGQGLKEWPNDNVIMKNSMERIEVVHDLAIDYLISVPDSSFECVYIDPMFETTIKESSNINALHSITYKGDLTDEMIIEAKRVSKERVVLKDHFRSERFQAFAFQQIKRKSAKFHYGVWEKR